MSDSLQDIIAACEARGNEYKEPAFFALAATLRNGGGCPKCLGWSTDVIDPCSLCDSTGVEPAVRELLAKAGL